MRAYVEEALSFYPETLDAADTAGLQRKRYYNLLFIESEQSIERIMYLDFRNTESIEIEVIPQEKRNLNLNVRPIFSNIDELGLMVSQIISI